MSLHYLRRGQGPPLLLVHGLGANSLSWSPILGGLAAHRDVIAVDLPGFGATPPLSGEVSIATLCDSVVDVIEDLGLPNISMAGSSMGARIVLELARRGVGGDVVSLNPGGFWNRVDLAYFAATLGISIRLIRALKAFLPTLCRNSLTRGALLAQLSAHPRAVPADIALHELTSYAHAVSFDAALSSLVHGPLQGGSSDTPGRVTLVWGRKDKVLLPRQAKRAIQLFPKAKLIWLESSGHFPQWDQPEETVRLILENT